MAARGHGHAVLRGTPKGGLPSVEVDADLAADLADLPPLPDGCAF